MTTAPEGLGAKGAKLWEEVTTEFVFDHEPDKAALLERACRITDLIEVLEAEAASQPLTARGSQGQPVANPLIGEARQQTNTLNQLIKSLRLEPSEATRLGLSEVRARAGKQGARARWSTTE